MSPDQVTEQVLPFSQQMLVESLQCGRCHSSVENIGTRKTNRSPCSHRTHILCKIYGVLMIDAKKEKQEGEWEVWGGGKSRKPHRDDDFEEGPGGAEE